MKLLITQGTAPFAQRVAKHLHQDLGAQVCFASADPIPQVLLDTGHYQQIPAAGHPTFAHEMLKLVLDQEATHLLPLGMEEVVVLAASKLLFNEYDIQVLIPGIDDIDSGDVQVMENPPRQLELLLLDRGQQIGPASVSADGRQPAFPEKLSGVFCFSDEGEPYLCLSAARREISRSTL